MGQKPPQPLTLSVIKKVYSNWRLWVFLLPYVYATRSLFLSFSLLCTSGHPRTDYMKCSRMSAESGSGTSYFNLYLQWAGYSVVQVNVLPTAGNALSIVTALAFGMLADATGRRLVILIGIQMLVLVSNVLLSVWHIPAPALLFAYYLSYVGAGAQPIVIVRNSYVEAPFLPSSFPRPTVANPSQGLGSLAEQGRSKPQTALGSDREHFYLLFLYLASP